MDILTQPLEREVTVLTGSDPTTAETTTIGIRRIELVDDRCYVTWSCPPITSIEFRTSGTDPLQAVTFALRRMRMLIETSPDFTMYLHEPGDLCGL